MKIGCAEAFWKLQTAFFKFIEKCTFKKKWGLQIICLLTCELLHSLQCWYCDVYFCLNQFFQKQIQKCKKQKGFYRSSFFLIHLFLLPKFVSTSNFMNKHNIYLHSLSTSEHSNGIKEALDWCRVRYGLKTLAK